VEDVVPEVLRRQPHRQPGVLGVCRGGQRGKGVVDGLAAGHEAAGALVGGGVDGPEPEGSQGAHHPHPHLGGLRAVVQSRQEVSVQVDVVLHGRFEVRER
jgi:hypothetical protein